MTAPAAGFWPELYLQHLAFILTREGGKVDNPHDPGGRTAFGVTQRVYDRWRRRAGLPLQDVWLITPDEVRSIYYAEYYRPATEGATGRLTLITFDTAVNMGVGRARQWLLARPQNDPDGYLERRRLEYHHIVAEHPVSEEFLVGWLYRLRALRKAVDMPPSIALEKDYRIVRAAHLAKYPTAAPPAPVANSKVA